MLGMNWAAGALRQHGPRIGAQLAAQMGFQVVGSATQSAFNPATREIDYRANAKARNLVPGIADVLRLWHSRRISSDQMAELLSYHGADATGKAGPLHATKLAWRELVRYARPPLPLELVRSWHRQGRATPTYVKESLIRHGLPYDSETAQFMDDWELLGAAEVAMLLYTGAIDDGEAKDRLRYLGLKTTDASALVDAFRSPLPVMESLALWNRGKITDTRLDELLKRNGLLDVGQREEARQLARVIPPPSDLILFSVREAWSDSVAAEYGLDRERTADFDDWMGAQGFNGSARFTEEKNGDKPTLTWPQAYWRAHWRYPSAEQAYHMLHRLRGDPRDPSTWSMPGVRPFTRDDLDAVLRIQDIAPAFREQLAAVSYTPVRLVDIRNAYYQNIRPRSWVIERLLDRGLEPTAAVDVADIYRRMKRERERSVVNAMAKSAERQYYQHVLDQYRLGILTRDRAHALLVANQWRPGEANAALDNVDFAVEEENVKALVKRVRSDFFNGITSYEQAEHRLTQAGLNPGRVANLMMMMRTEYGERRKVLATEKVLRLHREGLLSAAVAAVRLTLIGWNQADVLLQLQEVQLQIAKDRVSQLKAVERDRRAAAKEIERLIRQQEQRAKSLAAHLRTIKPRSTILRWLKSGRINRDQAMEQLAMQGYDRETAAAYLDEASSGPETE